MIPMACRNEYTMVFPTSFMPRLFSSLDMVSDRGDDSYAKVVFFLVAVVIIILLFRLIPSKGKVGEKRVAYIPLPLHSLRIAPMGTQ